MGGGRARARRCGLRAVIRAERNASEKGRSSLPGLRQADQILRAVPVVLPKVTLSREIPHHPGNVIELFQPAGC